MRSIFLAALLLAQTPLRVPWAQEPSPGQDAPYDIRENPVPDEARRMFELLGYSLDTVENRIVGPEGSLSAAAVASYYGPFRDDPERPLSPDLRARLQFAGLRFAEDGYLLAPPAPGQRMSRLEVEQMLHAIALQDRDAILERASKLLERTDPSRPMPPETAAALRALAESNPTALPDSLRRLFTGAQAASVEDMRRSVSAAHLGSIRFWDGQRTRDSDVEAAVPVPASWNQPRQRDLYFSGPERRLGGQLTEVLAAHLDADPVGRELLGHLRGPGGRGRLPQIMILQTNARPGATGYNNAAAVYNQSSDAIMISMDYLRDRFIASTPPGDRERLRRQLASPESLTAYLLENEAARRNFIRSQDVTFFHELTHAWQHRRDRMLLNMERGNTPSAIHLEYEHEAFLMQNRYLHSRLLADPQSLVGQDSASDYVNLLTDFDRWRDGITQSYTSSFPSAAATFPTLNELQARRIGQRLGDFIGDILSNNPSESSRLRLIGTVNGAGAINQTSASHDRRMDAFRRDEYPRMRFTGWRALARFYELQNDPGGVVEARRMAVLASGPQGAGLRPGEADAARRDLDAAAATTLTWLNTAAGRDAPVERRLSVVVSLARHYASRPPEAFPAIQQSAYRSAVDHYLSQAASAADAAARSHLFDAAAAYANALGDQALITRVANARRPR